MYKKRKEDLNKLKSYTNEIDKDLTMILQTLQWDRKHILEHTNMTTCIYDANHEVLSTKVGEHQQECLLRHNGYTRNDALLPDPVDSDVSTLIKLDKEAITFIIDNAAKSEPTFKRAHIDTIYGSVRPFPVYLGCGVLEPLSLGRLQCAYTSDERRAIHDAVVSAAPSCHDLTDLALPSANDADETPKAKSRTEILAELRDMRRRRTKYRVAAKSRNYSDVLRDVIKTQMEHYNEAIGDVKPDVDQVYRNIDKGIENNDSTRPLNNNGRNEYAKEFFRRSGKDNDRNQNKQEGSNRDIRSNGEENERRHTQYDRTDRWNEDDIDKRRSRRDDTDNRYRKRSRTNKGEVISEDVVHRDRSKHNSKDNYNEKYKYRERYESKHRTSDRESRHYRSRAYDEDRDKDQRDGSIYHERHRGVSDRERARNLITEIKREMYADGRMDNKLSSSGSSTEIKQETKYICHMSSRSDNHKYEDKNESKRYKNKYRRHEYRDRERDHDEREASYNKNNNHKSYESRRDRSRENERKRSRTDEKHKIYSEIYLEINKKLNKLNEK